LCFPSWERTWLSKYAQALLLLLLLLFLLLLNIRAPDQLAAINYQFTSQQR
jgi:hypothetical protein